MPNDVTTQKEAWEPALEKWAEEQEGASYNGDQARAFRDGYLAAKAEQEAAVRAAKREAVAEAEAHIRAKLFSPKTRRNVGVWRQAIPVLFRELLAKYSDDEPTKETEPHG